MQNSRFGFLLLWTILAVSARADEFQWEIGANYLSESTDFSAPLFIGIPAPTPVPQPILRIETETDTTGFFARWYLQPVDDGDGPRSRADFVDRASSVSVSYQQTKASTSFDPDPLSAFPPAGFLPIVIDPVVAPADPPSVPLIFAPGPALDADDLSFAGRYVSEESNWYVLGGATFGSASFDGLPDSDIDVTVLRLGVGLYVAEFTTIDLSVINRNADGNFLGAADDSSTDIGVNVSHLGALGETWQFGIDAGLVFADVGDDRVRLQGSLYPTRDIAFGLSIESRSDDFLDDGSRFTVFGSWFVNSGLQLSASIGRDRVDSSPGTDADGEQFGLGVTARFK